MVTGDHLRVSDEGLSRPLTRDSNENNGRDPRRIVAETVTTEAGFDQLHEEWNHLVARLAPPSPFQTWEWQRAWWRHFADTRHERLSLVCFRREGILIGVAPFKRRTRLGLVELSPLGWRDRITEYLVFLFPAGDRAVLMEALWGWLSSQQWGSVCLPQLGEGDYLAKPAKDLVVSSQPIVFESLVLPASWHALDRGLKKSMRSNVRYYPKLLAREGHPYGFEIARSPDQVAAALPILWTLHTARAAARTRIRHRDYLKQPRRRAFLLEAMPLLAARGEAAVGLVRIDGEVVGAQLWLERDGVIWLYYSGFLPVWAKYSVAMITTMEIFKDAILRGVERIEFLRGANHFKSRWGTVARVETEYVLARLRRLIGAREAYNRQVKSLTRWIERRRAQLEAID
jgi:CelD/BcsL family acetyltransferase involved in cellulose biosynthesis